LNSISKRRCGTARNDTPADVIRDGLRLLQDHDILTEIRRSELRHEIQKGFDSVARGEFTEYDRSTVRRIADDVKAAGR
jgi:hypothetical protein